MPSTLEQLSPNRVKLTITMTFDELKPTLDKAYKDIAGQVNVPGFRKGKVPAAVIDQRFGRGTVLQQAINDALPEAYGKAVEENDIVPLGQPEVDVTKLEDGELVEFTAEVDVRPDFEVPDPTTITVEVPAVSVPDEDVDQRIELLRERFATTTEVERAAEKGDVVVIDLAGSRDGEPLADATAEGITYKVGSEGMLEGLDDAVVGLTAGQDATFHSTLVGGALRGQEADIKVTVTKVSSQELPEVDDDFAQLVSQFDTVDEMKADLKKALENQARLDQAADARDNVLQAVIDKVEFELPSKLVESEIEARRQQVSQQLAQAGLTVEQYLEDSEEEADNEDDFWAEIEKRSIDALRAQIVLDKLADDEKSEVEQNDLTQLLFQKAQQNGTSPEQEAQHMMEHNHIGEWMQEIRRGKALANLVMKATVKDSEGNVVDLDTVAPDGSVVEPAEEGALAAAAATEELAAAAATEELAAAAATEELAAAAATEEPAAAADTAADEKAAEEEKAAEAPAAEEKADKKPARKAPAKKPAARKTTKKTAAKAEADES
ncbi:trigger factor [Acidipropionibacterium timonense]|uniref:trigger factor n=1 Tax=Acidipropionibacterium timonense TaxID=2161818 RepID=UPI0010315959|nr:trigger factor [Acidipropionibacterium timonense]